MPRVSRIGVEPRRLRAHGRGALANGPTFADASRMDLVLASSSIYRRELLARLGVPFEHLSPDIDETPGAGESPAAMVLRLALGKARRIAAERPTALVIGSDQTAVGPDGVLGKPGTEANAVAMLERVSGRAVTFLTALVLLDGATGAAHQHVDETTVRFRELEANEIRRYVARERPLDCAGAIKSEGLGVTLLESIDSSDPTALIGLPLIELCRMLRAAGFDPLLQES